MNSRITNRTTLGRMNQRTGSAVVELALSIPLIVLFVFGSIGASNAIYMQQVVTEVAYQGALEGIKVSATEQSVINRMQIYIDQTSLNGVTFEVIGTDGTAYDNLSSGQSFRVVANAPADSMSFNLMALPGFNDISGFRIANRQ